MEHVSTERSLTTRRFTDTISNPIATFADTCADRWPTFSHLRSGSTLASSSPRRQTYLCARRTSAPPRHTRELSIARTLFLVLRREQRVEQPPLVPQTLRQGMLVRRIHRLLARLDSDRALARNGARHRDCLLHDLALAFPDDARHHAPVRRLFRGEVAAGEGELHGARLADGLREALRAAAAGDDADVDLGLAEGRGGRGEDDVAHERELAAAAELWGNGHG